MINNYCFHIFHIQAKGIAEYENKKKRYEEGQVKTPEVPYEMVILLSCYSLNIY
jgi:hypothetical protein